MEFFDRAALPSRAAILLELLFRHSATPKRRYKNGYFVFNTAYLRKGGIAKSTIRRELRRLERLKLIRVQPYKDSPGHPLKVFISDRFFGARNYKWHHQNHPSR
jgi:hypothetical protein